MEYRNDIDSADKRPSCGDGCEKECNLFTSVKLPVELEPRVRLDEAEVECCGEPVIKCECAKDGNVKLMIEQNIFVRIPVCYGIDVKDGKPELECHDDKK